MTRLHVHRTTIAAAAILLTAPIAAGAQVPGVADRPGRCPASPVIPAPVTPQARRDAQQFAGRAQAASIQGDNVAATDLYAKAAQLDPTDPGIAYSLGREYEATHDERAMAQYCRFLALAPSAPEAANVRQRIADLALALPPDTSIVAVPVVQRDRMPSPGAALISGLVVPGAGQFMTHNPAVGVVVLAISAGAAYWGLQSQNVTTQVTRTAVDPLGHSYQYQTAETQSQRPNLAAGVGAAAAVSVIAAIQAYSQARTGREKDARASALSRPAGVGTPSLVLGTSSVGLAVPFR